MTYPRLASRPQGRPLNLRETARQVGTMNLLAISGGRIGYVNESTAVLPVSAGYSVEIFLAADDTYTVTRVFKRKGVKFDHGTMTGVYCDQLGEIAYQASSFRSYEFGSQGQVAA